MVDAASEVSISLGRGRSMKSTSKFIRVKRKVYVARVFTFGATEFL